MKNINWLHRQNWFCHLVASKRICVGSVDYFIWCTKIWCSAEENIYKSVCQSILAFLIIFKWITPKCTKGLTLKMSQSLVRTILKLLLSLQIWIVNSCYKCALPSVLKITKVHPHCLYYFNKSSQMCKTHLFFLRVQKTI